MRCNLFIIVRGESGCLDMEGYKLKYFFLCRGIEFILFLDFEILNIDIFFS